MATAAPELVRFGKTDLWVSRLCQGTAFRESPRDPSNEVALGVLDRCIDLGVNFFDSAYSYAWGGSERLLGKAVAGRRDRLVICTKVPARFPPDSEGATSESVRFTREHLHSSAEASLKRLGTDYLDIYMLHMSDGVTPALDIVASMDTLVRSGKVRHWGVSNHTAEQVSEFVELGERTGTAPIVGLEDYYTLAGASVDDAGGLEVRRLEREMFPLLRQTCLGLITYSPRQGGDIAPGRSAEPGTPLADLLLVLDRVAEDLEASRAQVCIAWVLSHPEVTCALAAAELPSMWMRMWGVRGSPFLPSR